jgi:choline dehydrogenase-like flavoprotein
MEGLPDIVVGTGPAGVAAAMALLAKGRRVVLLDGGKAFEAEHEARRQALAARDPAGWTAADVAGWQGPQSGAAPGQVRRYGSDFAMEPADATFAEAGDVALRASRAGGGLSSLWGSAVLPYSPHDTAGWPVSPEEFAPHYRAVAGFLPVSGRVDALQGLFPALPMEGRTALPASPQGAALLARMDRQAGALGRRGVTVGMARQAVASGCRTCGQCLHGCPWELIWSARYTLRHLAEDSRVTYRPGAVVARVEDGPDGATAHLADGTSVRGARLFLGAGVLETARILMTSRPGLTEVALRDSQQAFLPMLHPWSAGARPDRTPAHTLAQMFVEIDDPAVSPWLVHGQVYSWNEFYRAELLAKYGRLPLAGPVFGALSRRLIVAQAFLHSDHSAKIALTLAADGRLKARTVANPDTFPTLTRALKAMAGAFRLGGMIPLLPAARPGAPGSSFHVGASFPMAAAPNGASSDTLGRPLGMKHVHLIDASSLPAIPATTITFGVMANAHRIAAMAPV